MTKPANRSPRYDRNPWVYRAMIAFGQALFRVLDLRRQVRGEEHLPTSGGAVLAMSHFSYLDFALVQWAVWRRRRRYVRFMATVASFGHPVGGPLLRAMAHIPVDREKGASGFRYASKGLEQGEVVGLFPETRVSRSFTLLPFKTGAARLAARTGVPIVPCVIWGSHRVITRSRTTDLKGARHTPITIAFGPPLRPGPDDDPVVVTEQLRQSMLALLADAQQTYPVTAPPGTWWEPAHRGGSAPTPEEAAEIDRTDYRRKIDG